MTTSIATSPDITSYTRTISGNFLQAVSSAGVAFRLYPNSTLNEKFGVQSGVAPDDGVYPKMRYITIGNRGHSTVIGGDQAEYIKTLKHQPTDAACFNHIPFVLRELSNDLPAEKKSRYCLRVLETHGQKQYIAYYGRRFDTTMAKSGLSTVITKDGQVSTKEFEFSAENLNPTPSILDSEGTVLGSDTTEEASVVITLNLDSFDMQEIYNASTIRSGMINSPVVSEFAFVSGVDKTVAAAEGGSTYNEVIAAQINIFITTHIPVGFSTEGTTLTFEIGGSEPQMATTRG